jgi:hypothetical protein
MDGMRWRSARLLRSRASRRWYRKASLPWWLHVAGWLALAMAVAVVLGPWFAALGVVVFEAGLAALVLRARPYAGRAGRGRGSPGGGLGGVREPRRPLPTSGTGAAAAVPF